VLRRVAALRALPLCGQGCCLLFGFERVELRSQRGELLEQHLLELLLRLFGHFGPPTRNRMQSIPWRLSVENVRGRPCGPLANYRTIQVYIPALLQNALPKNMFFLSF
jgi:hypothetical protein